MVMRRTYILVSTKTHTHTTTRHTSTVHTCIVDVLLTRGGTKGHIRAALGGGGGADPVVSLVDDTGQGRDDRVPTIIL